MCDLNLTKVTAKRCQIQAKKISVTLNLAACESDSTKLAII